jgi:hypothetical protein
LGPPPTPAPAGGTAPARLDATLDVADASPRLVVERDPSEAEDSVDAQAVVALPSGATLPVELHRVSATRLEGLLPPGALTAPGDYRATIRLVGDDANAGDERRSTIGWYWTGTLELQSRGINMPLLTGVARASGGDVLPPLGDASASAPSIFRDPRRRGSVTSAPWCFLGALLLLSFDYLRRQNVPVRSRP